MAHAKLVPEGKPPELGPVDGPASTWIPAPGGSLHLPGHDHKPSALIDLQRVSAREVGALMGKAHRNPVTGAVQIKGFGVFQDFHVADMWTRNQIVGSPDQLSHDPYLFKPIPLHFRTWIYHHYFRAGKILLGASGADEDAMIRHILSMRCIDANVSAGRWAPAMLYIPMILLLTLAADILAVLAAVSCLLAVNVIQKIMNTPELYRWSRLVHLPLRLALFFYIMTRMATKSSLVSTLSFVVAIIICLLEILMGDGGSLRHYGLHCNYEVVRVLPNRIFVCRRHGAAHSEEILGRSAPVCEKITGMGSWEQDFALIADVKGLIVELRPMEYEDWKLVFQEKQSEEEIVHRFIGLDVYSPGAATIDALNAAIDEQKKSIKQKAAVELLQRFSSDSTMKSPTNRSKAMIVEDA